MHVACAQLAGVAAKVEENAAVSCPHRLAMSSGNRLHVACAQLAGVASQGGTKRCGEWLSYTSKRRVAGLLSKRLHAACAQLAGVAAKAEGNAAVS
jgi:hypothetical protein